MSKTTEKDQGLSESQEMLDADLSVERGQWDNQVQFLLTCVGYVVGLGNIYRFPFMVYSFGGGSFLVAYFILNFTFALGLVLLEMTPAQYSGRGPQSVWACVPIFKGCGISSIVIMLLIAVPFCSIYTWSWYYLFASFTSLLPWATCGNSFNSELCYAKNEASFCEEGNGTFWNMKCYNATMAEQLNLTNMTALRVPATLEFFTQKLYQVDYENTISNVGGLKWDLVLTSLFSWSVTFLCVIKGISSVGKVVYFSATFPYLVLAVMIGRGATLPGSMDGVNFYLATDWSKLAMFDTWAYATTQIMFSVAVGFGGMMTFSSYNRFKNNLVRDAFIIVTVNGLTSFYAGFAVFTVLGFMAYDLGTTVDKVIQNDFLLAFVTYPEVVTRIAPAPLWSFLFFFMLITVALDSVITGVEVLMTGVLDTFPRLRPKKTYIALVMCVFLFLFTLPECTQGGIFFVILLDWYVATFAVPITVLFEIVALVYFYGPLRLRDDVSIMVGKANWWNSCLQYIFLLLWVFICPAVLIALILYWCVKWIPLSFGEGFGAVPNWAIVLGWLSGTCTLLSFPLGALHAIYKSYEDVDYNGSFGRRCVKLFRPLKEWGPRKDREPDAAKKKKVPTATLR